jgi:APA family basic amino acid/polyamine antiporter
MQTDGTSFKKQLTLFDSIAIVAGSMIGSGIFIISADIARTVENFSCNLLKLNNFV